MNKKYYYKHSKVKGQIYLQIWERMQPRDELVHHCGSAEKLHSKLVKLKNIEESAQTKTNSND